MSPIYRWRTPQLLVAVALAGALSAGACGSNDPPMPPRFTACDVLSRSDVEASLGGGVGAPAQSRGGGSDTLAGRSGCAWSRTDHTKAVLIELVRTDDMATQVRRTGFSAEARFDAVRSEYPDAKEHPEIGSQTRYVETTATLHVLEGASYLTIEVATASPEEAESTAVALARRAVIRVRQADRAN